MSVYGIHGQGWTVISSEPSSANELYHHGIPGMKWGVRRTPEQLGHRQAKTEETKNRLIRSSGSRNSETLRKARGEDINKLSNQQLRDYNDRLNLEQNYARLTEGHIKQGKDWITKTVVSGIIVGAVSTVTKQVVTSWLKAKWGI